jgi:hypothetical protein
VRAVLVHKLEDKMQESDRVRRGLGVISPSANDKTAARANANPQLVERQQHHPALDVTDGLHS